jgi:hypothetical protein
MANAARKPLTAAASDSQELDRQIRQRAYELYAQRGGGEGRELDDWLRAEEEISGKKVRAASGT